jgi:hypothetical protein
MHVVILMPLRDDWSSAAKLIDRLDQTLPSNLYTAEILLVDDGSTEECKPEAFSSSLRVIKTVQVLTLRRNLGHQRAIAIGLVHIEQKIQCDAVLVMDSDGEDTPDGVLQLIQAYSQITPPKAIFAERTRRTESRNFRFFYKIYKLAHFLFTGISVRVGNFSILPPAYLHTLVVMSELWNHYAAAVFRSGLRFTTTPIPRGHRIAGRSRMNFVSLAAHGLSAMSVFGDIIGVRLLIGSIAGSLLAVIGIVIVLAIRFFTDKAIPGWATYVSGTLAVIVIQFIAIAISFTFTLLSSRTNLAFVPLRDSALFVAHIQKINGQAKGANFNE